MAKSPFACAQTDPTPAATGLPQPVEIPLPGEVIDPAEASGSASFYADSSEDVSLQTTEGDLVFPEYVSEEVEADDVDEPANANEIIYLQGSEEDDPVVVDAVEEESVVFGDWLGYNSTKDDMTWLFGNADRLGIFSLESYPALDIGEDSALMIGMGFHFVNGPVATDLPPRLFDFQMAYQSRKVHSDRFVLDYRIGVGAFSDFEGSARKGIRFPGHIVTYYEWHPWFISVFGVESLDRDDVSVLPVAGFVWRPTRDLVYEIVFPRPRVQVKLNSDYALYLSGELGGGTWAIERVGGINDNATYRDFRLLAGVMEFEEDDSAIEVGWAFNRKLDYRSGVGSYHPDDTFLLQFRTHY